MTAKSPFPKPEWFHGPNELRRRLREARINNIGKGMSVTSAGLRSLAWAMSKIENDEARGCNPELIEQLAQVVWSDTLALFGAQYADKALALSAAAKFLDDLQEEGRFRDPDAAILTNYRRANEQAVLTAFPRWANKM